MCVYSLLLGCFAEQWRREREERRFSLSLLVESLELYYFSPGYVCRVTPSRGHKTCAGSSGNTNVIHANIFFLRTGYFSVHRKRDVFALEWYVIKCVDSPFQIRWGPAWSPEYCSFHQQNRLPCQEHVYYNVDFRFLSRRNNQREWFNYFFSRRTSLSGHRANYIYFA